MKRLYTLAVAMGTAVLASAQITGLSVETVVEHDGTIPELAGHTTYRVYADVTSNTDFISAVYGNQDSPLMLGTDGTFFHEATTGGDFGQQVVPLLFDVFPASEYDSWVTIGISNSNEGTAVQNTPSTLADAFASFNAGEGFVVNDPIGGSWFNLLQCTTDLETCANEDPAFGGADNRVLLAQLTSTGDVYGVFNMQVFPAGNQDEEIKQTLTFSSDASDVFGCTNPAATGNEEGEGMYDATATIDDFSCVLPCTVDLSVSNFTAPTCHGDADASIVVEAMGAQGADYFYLDSIGTQQGLNFGNFGNLFAGTYTAYVEDAAGCRDSVEVVVPVTEPIEVTVELTAPVSCAGAEDAELSVASATGGTGDFTYFLSIDPENTTMETTWTGLAPGQTVSVWATDSNGCIQQSSNSIAITSPTPISVSLSTSGTGILDATCADTEDGGIFLVGLGGNAPATIEFSVDGMNFSPSPVTVSGGTYTVIAQDVYGCQVTMAESVVVGPAAIEVNAMAMAEVCFEGNDGEVSWAPVGGEGAYTYVFNGEATTSTSASDLAPGDYEVVVTDGNNCSSTATVTVDAGVAIVASTSVIDAECAGENDGEVTVTAEGGSGAFQYSDDGVNFADGNVFDDLNAGSYTFFVQDEFGCSGSVTANVSEPAAIEISGIVSEGAVTGEGSIDINITGGLPPYDYEWIGPGVSGTTDQDLTGISTGVYIVEVTDANGCSSDETFNLTTSIQEIAAGVVASVFPNPSQGLFAVEIAGQTQGAVDYHVLDAQGRMLTQGQWIGAGQLFRETLDLTGADAGLYQLVLVANGQPTAVQIVKMN